MDEYNKTADRFNTIIDVIRRDNKQSTYINRPTEEQLYEDELQAEQLREKRLANDHNELTKNLKESIVGWVRHVVSRYLCFVGCILIAIMVCAYYDKHLLSDTVLITLLTTTTINMLGLPHVIISGLFKPRADNA